MKFIGKMLENYSLKKGVYKAANFIMAAISGVMTSPYFVEKIAPILNNLGIRVDKDKLETGLIIVLTGLVGMGINYLKQKTKIGRVIF